jgi:hypothetical protein
MLSSAFLALLALSSAQQPSDPSTRPREAYTQCLRQFMEQATRDRMAADAFQTALSQQCSAQEQAFRQALVTRERGYRTPAAEIDQIVTDELNDARSNIRELFAMGTTPRQQ